MKQIDIARAIRAAHSEGLVIEQIEVDAEKVVLVMATQQLQKRGSEANKNKEELIAATNAKLKVVVKDLIELGRKRRAAEKKITHS